MATKPLPPAATGVHPKHVVEIGEGAEPMTLSELQRHQSAKGRSWMDLYGPPSASQKLVDAALRSRLTPPSDCPLV